MASSSSLLTGISRAHLMTAAGLAGAALVGYCIYFDHKRRSAPDYKQKIRERRREQARHASDPGRPLPDIRNPAEIQAYFLQEVQLGEELIAEGSLEQGVEHLCNAIVLCGQSQQLLQIFQQTLSPAQFALLVEKLPVVRAKFARMYATQADDGEGEDALMNMVTGGGEQGGGGMPGAAQGLIDPDLE